MRRPVAFAVALVSLAAAVTLGPRPAASRTSVLVAVSGPLRPFLADVLWIRFEQSLLRRDHFSLVEDAGRLLRLRPDVPELRARLAYAFVLDVPGELAESEMRRLHSQADGFTVTGYRLELSGYCSTCLPEGSGGPLSA